jgi:4-amino-4-deoxy-L-arabinose transferase-like glycosyltransferase
MTLILRAIKIKIPIWLLFCLLAVFLRFFSFFPSVIDHDESTYLEISRMILSGKTLYVDMIDIKPPGIFLILAGFQAVFGFSVFVIRFLVAIWIGLTAFMIYLTGKWLLRDTRASIAAGIIYIFLISTWSFYGISITPEIFFNLFTISALYLLLTRKNAQVFFWAGLLAGTGFIVKYLVLFDFLAFMAFIIYQGYRSDRNNNALRLIPSLLLAGMGFILPFLVFNLWYYFNGHFDAFYNIVYLAPSKYPSAFNPLKMLIFILDFHLRYLPVFFFFYYALLQNKLIGDEIASAKRLVVIWSVMALMGVLIAGKTFGHYTIQLMLPLSLAAGLFFHSENIMPFKLDRIATRKTGLAILTGIVLIISMMKLEYVLRKDIPREIAAYLETRLSEEDVIYAGNYHQIIYYLLKKDSPTKYVHRSLLTGDNHIKALDIDAESEFSHIMAQRPKYIIIQEEYPDGMMKDFILENYTMEKGFGRKVYLFRIKSN